jgi:hypothetical protein
MQRKVGHLYFWSVALCRGLRVFQINGSQRRHRSCPRPCLTAHSQEQHRSTGADRFGLASEAALHDSELTPAARV